MFYEKSFSVDKPVRKRYRFSSFRGFDADSSVNTLPCDYCEDVYNFGFEHNSLTGGAGLRKFACKCADGSEYELPPVPDGYSDARIFFGRLSDENGPFECLFLSAPDKFTYIKLCDGAEWENDIPMDRQFTSAIGYLHGEDDLMLLGGGGDGLYVLSGKGGEFAANALAITDLCTHYERVYAVVDGTRTSVWFSDAFDPYNWNVSLDEGGYISLDGSLGEVLRVLSFEDYIFIFCEYGIYRLTAYADQLQFSIKRVNCDCGRIYKDTITVCGAAVMFVTSDGVYTMDGYDVAKLTDRLDEIADGAEDMRAFYCFGKYWLSFRKEHEEGIYSFTEDDGNPNVLAVTDIEKGTTEIYRGAQLSDMCVLSGARQNCVVALSGLSDCVAEVDDSGSFFTNQPFRYWAIRDVDFNEHVNKKYIVGVDYCTDTPFILGVVADGKTKEYYLEPEDKYVPISACGLCFDFYIKCTARDVRIKPFGITIDFYRRNK